MSSTIESPAVAVGEPEEGRAPVDLTKYDQAVAEAADAPTGEQAAAADAPAGLKERATALVAEGGPVRAHLDRAWQTTGAWLATQDVTDEQLVEELLRQRALTHKQRETELRRQLARVSSEIIAAKRAETADVRTNDPHRDGEQVTLLKGRRELLETQLREHREALPELLADAPGEGEVGQARWGRKAGRAGALVAAVVGGGIYLPMQDPMWLLAALPAAAVALWRAGARAEDDAAPDGQDLVGQDLVGPRARSGKTGPGFPAGAVRPEGGPVAEAVAQDPAPAGAEQQVAGPAFAAVVLEAQRVAAEQTAPGAAAARQVAEAAASAAQVQGAGDLVAALLKAGIISRGEEEETKVIGVIRPDGPGWTATVELPGGRPAAQAIGRDTELASALRVKAAQLQLSADTSEEGHEGRVVIWCANSANPYAGPAVRSELIDADSWDFWTRGVPLGSNARGVRKVLNMIWASLLIGGLPNYGKSYLARLIAAAAALDPYVKIVLLTGKTGADWAALKLVADSYVAGNSPAAIREMHRVMEETIAEMSAKGERLERLFEDDPKSCPEGKITPGLARTEGLELTLLIVEELQEILDAAAGMKLISSDEDADPDEGGRKNTGRNGKDVLVSQFARFIRVSRYVGGMEVVITQRPDSTSVPTTLREVAPKRACYRVKGRNSSKMVLGDDAVDAGAAPHLLMEHHKGVVVLDEGGEEGHDTVRADVINLDDFRQICERGRALRIQAGTLTGYAAEGAEAEQADGARREFLMDVIDAMAVLRTDGARLEELAEEMVLAHPRRWADLTPERLGELMRTHGAGTTVKLARREDGSRPNGYRRDAIEALLQTPKTP